MSLLFDAGGRSFNKLQSDVNERFHAREKRNAARDTAAMAALEERANRIGTPDVDTLERMRDLRARQEAIRQESHERAVMGFIKHKN